MKPVFITGYMASGKTTFGRALARRLDLDFIDLDFYIEQRFHKKIPDIFANEGEERFREMERNMLREVGEMEDVVISCGGGTPCFFNNADYMDSRGTTVFLATSVEVIVRRLLCAKGKRPLVDGKDEDELRDTVEAHLAERQPYYGKARITFEGDNLDTPRQITASIDRFLPLLSDMRNEIGGKIDRRGSMA